MTILMQRTRQEIYRRLKIEKVKQLTERFQGRLVKIEKTKPSALESLYGHRHTN